MRDIPREKVVQCTTKTALYFTIITRKVEVKNWSVFTYNMLVKFGIKDLTMRCAF